MHVPSGFSGTLITKVLNDNLYVASILEISLLCPPMYACCVHPIPGHFCVAPKMPCDLAFHFKTFLYPPPPPPSPSTLLKMRKRCFTFSCSVHYCNVEAICILRSSSPVILPNMNTLVLSTCWPMQLGCPVFG